MSAAMDRTQALHRDPLHPGQQRGAEGNEKAGKGDAGQHQQDSGDDFNRIVPVGGHIPISGSRHRRDHEIGGVQPPVPKDRVEIPGSDQEHDERPQCEPGEDRIEAWRLIPAAVQQRTQIPADRGTRPPERETGGSAFQLGNIAIDNEISLRRQDGIVRELGLAVDRNDPRTEGVLRRRDGIACHATALGDACGEGGQWAVRLGKLQPAESGGVDRSRGIGCRRVPGERQDRAIRQILFDFAGESPVELPQNDANARIGVARQQRRVQVELVVGRQREDRDRPLDAGPSEPLAAVRPRADEDGAHPLYRAGKVGPSGPQHDNSVALQRAKLLCCAERERVAADDDQYRIVGARHCELPHPSGISGSGG
jgi:hypothetical protein